MFFWKQEYLHRPDEDPFTIGDCQRAVLACLLERDLADVPHFGAMSWPDADEHRRLTAEWLEAQGYKEVSIPYDGSFELEQVMAAFAAYNPDTYYMLTGLSKNDTAHVVICCNTDLVWDTSKDNSGVQAPIPDEDTKQSYYWISVLVPTEIHARDVEEDYEEK